MDSLGLGSIRAEFHAQVGRENGNLSGNATWYESPPSNCVRLKQSILSFACPRTTKRQLVEAVSNYKPAPVAAILLKNEGPPMGAGARMGKQMKAHRVGGRVRTVLCERILVLHCVPSAHKLDFDCPLLHSPEVQQRRTPATRMNVCGVRTASVVSIHGYPEKHQMEEPFWERSKKLRVVRLPN